MKTLLLSTGVLSAALVLKLSLPTILSFLLYELPLLYGSLHSWLTPPYLYFVINGIIITIAASSRFQHKEDEAVEPAPAVKVVAVPDPVGEIRPVFGVTSEEFEAVVAKAPAEIRPGYESAEPEVEAAAGKTEEDEEEEEFVISRSDYSLSRGNSMEIPSEYAMTVAERPPASARFSHRKSVKASPEGSKLLKVSKPKRHETLESTWKTITEGRPMPLTRHLKKSETFESYARARIEETSTPMKKSETFKERTGTPSVSPSPGSGKLRKEPSPSQDDLNRRVEAFIKKFNEEMRLQRQESFKHYMEMVSRGSH
ncbi:hypothetical protein H6P81_005656 [Aristolochia fimbriata]|uniref:DUF4408 domain-containing protein n=1 Tax=Aristolochia fimbriata TaxID=158543 RepID=A0AAV7EV70_ARIFI|nr:hypothetical protein H6P81_005656 [Aristolochia fimbriata]